MKSLHMVAWILLIVGGLNWLLMGLFKEDLFSLIGLGMSIARIVYILVGLSAVLELFTHKGYCKNCGTSGTMPMGTTTMPR